MISSEFNGKCSSRSLPNVPERFKSCWNLGVRCSASKVTDDYKSSYSKLCPTLSSHYSTLLSWHHNTTVAVTISHYKWARDRDMNVSEAGQECVLPRSTLKIFHITQFPRNVHNLGSTLYYVTLLKSCDILWGTIFPQAIQ